MFYEVAEFGPFNIGSWTIGPITIHGYGLMIAIGLLCAILLANYRAKRKGLDTDLVFNLIIIAIVFGFLGAKLMYLIVEWKSFIQDPLGLLLSGSGFVVYGGIILGVTAAFLYCRWKKISFLKHFDLFMPSVAIAQGFGRLGCLGAGCCYGKHTDAFWGMVFHNSPLAECGVPLVPTQLLSSLGNFAIAGILLLYARRDKKPGSVGLLYMALYSIGRFVIEFYRADHRGSVGPLSTSQFISIIVFVITLTAFFIHRSRGLKDTEKTGEDKADKTEKAAVKDEKETEKAEKKSEKEAEKTAEKTKKEKE